MASKQIIPESGAVKNEDEDDHSDGSEVLSAESFNDEIMIESDEDDEKVKSSQEKRWKDRFGTKIKAYKLNNCIRIALIMLAIILVPLQIFLENTLQTAENEMITETQATLTNETSPGRISFYTFVAHTGEVEVFLFYSVGLFLASDSLNAFKCTMLYCFGLYFMIALKLMYESPRPFWVQSGIKAYPGLCKFDFSSPSTHLYNLSFFFTYITFMNFYKYTDKVYKPVLVVLFGLIFCYIVGMSVVLHAFGLLYYYQAVMSVLFSLIYLLVCINFDAEILSLFEKVGFIVRTSRKYKFQLLFFVICLFILGVMTVQAKQDSWEDQQIWIINASYEITSCQTLLENKSASKLGIVDTFQWSSILFWIIGMGFGCSYSLLDVNQMDFVRTSPLRKFLRLILGLLISVGLYIGIAQINQWYPTYMQETPSPVTQYFFQRAFPCLFISFLMYGPYLNLCQKLNLVGTGEKLLKFEENLIKKRTQSNVSDQFKSDQ